MDSLYTSTTFRIVLYLIYFQTICIDVRSINIIIVPGESPTNVKAEPISSTEIIVSWEPPPRDSWNGDLLGYRVGYQELAESSGSTERFEYKSVEVRPHFGGEATLQGLSKYTKYSIIVQVTHCEKTCTKILL